MNLNTSYCSKSRGQWRVICPILEMNDLQLDFTSRSIGLLLSSGRISSSSKSRWMEAWKTAGIMSLAICPGLYDEKVCRIFSASFVSSKRRFWRQEGTGLAAFHISSHKFPGDCILPLKWPATEQHFFKRYFYNWLLNLRISNQLKETKEDTLNKIFFFPFGHCHLKYCAVTIKTEITKLREFPFSRTGNKK